MNTIKGMVRIALVLAIIAIVPGFLGGWIIYQSEETIELKSLDKKILTPEEFDKRLTKQSASDFLDEKPRDLIEEMRKDPSGILYKSGIRQVEYHYPPNWQCTIAGVIGSIVAFLIVFFGISGITRVLLWIVVGFKDQKKPKK